MGVKETIIGLWWLYDIVFALGMLTALNVDDVKDNVVKKIAKGAIDNFVLMSKTKMPAHVERRLDRSKATLTYRLICTLLGVAFFFNFLVNVLADQRRSRIVNTVYLFYCLTTVYVSAHDILFHDDRSVWSVAAKRRHVFFPFNLEESRVFVKPTYGNQTETQLYTISNKLKQSLAPASVFAVLALYTVLPQLHFFWCFLVLGMQSHVTATIDNAFDYFCIKSFRNRYAHMFDSLTSIFFKGESHDQLGRQYQYFRNGCIPLEKVMKKKVFDKARSKKMSVKEAKALSYIARGCFMASMFWLFNLQNENFLFKTENSNAFLKFLSGSTPTMIYYGLHAWFAMLDKEDTFMDTPFKRILCFILEASLSGLLFYKPLFDVTRGTLVHNGTMAVSALVMIPTLTTNVMTVKAK